MRCKKMSLSAIFFLVLGFSGVRAQEAITSGGGNATGTAGTTSYTIGGILSASESSATTNYGGIQLPYEISVVTANKETSIIRLNCSVYPNPATDFIKLWVEGKTLAGMSFQLFDVAGSLLKQEEVIDQVTNIPMNNQLAGTYFLKVLREGENVKTFKIIKK